MLKANIKNLLYAFFINYDWVIRIRKNFILISLIFIMTVFLSSVSAAEFNNDTLEDVGDDPNI